MKSKLIKKIVILCSIIGLICTLHTNMAFADSEFSVSPMRQKVVLIPGETYNGSFDIINPSSSTSNLTYKTTIKPFYVDNSNEVIFENNGDYNQIIDWIKVTNSDGTIVPNSTRTINFTVSVPADAPAGGQYASIIVTNNGEDNDNNGSVNIKNTLSIAHIIYAEVAGNTNISGEITNMNIPGFLFSDNISASSTIKNDGNVHGTGKYSLQVFPLFSSEEIYTNEEIPTEKTIMPGQESTNVIYWDNTPAVGIFNVVYTVEFEGVTEQLSKMVIKCPIWLLSIIVLIIVALIIWIVIKVRGKAKSHSRAE